jgi:hypothetical protein
MENIEEAGIVTDVEETYYIYRGKIDTTYDTLINHYAQLLLDLNYYESELALTNKIIKTFSTGKKTVNEDANLIAKESLDAVIHSFNQLYNEFVITVKDYYNVRSADYMSFNSNVQTVANVNIKLYLVLANFLFIVLWTCFFVAWDRLKEILKANAMENQESIERRREGVCDEEDNSENKT